MDKSLPKILNTRLRLKYEDSSGQSVFLTEVLSGEITIKQAALIKDSIFEPADLIAEQVGLPTPAVKMLQSLRDWPNPSVDHVYTTLLDFESGIPDVSLMLTTEPPTLDLSVYDLVVKLRAADFSNTAVEWDRQAKIKLASEIDGPLVRRASLEAPCIGAENGIRVVIDGTNLDEIESQWAKALQALKSGAHTKYQQTQYGSFCISGQPGPASTI